MNTAVKYLIKRTAWYVSSMEKNEHNEDFTHIQFANLDNYSSYGGQVRCQKENTECMHFALNLQ